MRFPRPLTLTAAVVVLTLGMALGLPGSATQAQSGNAWRQGDPSEQEVREAIQVLRLYLAARRAERPTLSADTRPEPTARPRLPDFDGEYGAPLGGIATEDAPVLGDASISIDQQLHLADGSAVFKNQELFLWDDPAGMNLALGRNALSSTTGTATGNTAVGRGGLQNTIPYAASDLFSSYNTALGDQALYANTYGAWNTAVGFRALYSNTTGTRNTAHGYKAIYSNTAGYNNTAIGRRALFANLDGDSNAALGLNALDSNTTGSSNTAAGANALGTNVDGSANAAVGVGALSDNTSGDNNIAIGVNALSNNEMGNSNISVGQTAGFDAPVDASNNIFIANLGDAGDSTPTIRIGTDGTQTRTFIAGIDGNTVVGTQVEVTTAGELGVTAPSARRFKQAIEDLEQVGEELSTLRPVTFRYDPELVSGGGEPTVGLIAEEVAAVFPELVTRDDEGKPLGVRYPLLSVLLLDELQRQRELNLEQENALRAVQRRLRVLEDRSLNE